MPNYQLGKIYTITNDIDHTVYVGSTAVPRLSTRMAGHRCSAKDETTPLYNAMRKDGMEHFHIVLHHLFPCGSKDELVAEEMKLLDELIAAGKQVYNLIIGGKHSDEVKAKIGKANIGRKATASAKKKMSDARGGEKNAAFCFGCVGLHQSRNTTKWVFQWSEKGKGKSKSFSVAKYGNEAAKALAEAERKRVFPAWKPDEEVADAPAEDPEPEASESESESDSD